MSIKTKAMKYITPLVFLAAAPKTYQETSPVSSIIREEQMIDSAYVADSILYSVLKNPVPPTITEKNYANAKKHYSPHEIRQILGESYDAARKSRCISKNILTNLVNYESPQLDNRAIGDAGEHGLTQMMPETWKDATTNIYGKPLDFELAFDPGLNTYVFLRHARWLCNVLNESHPEWQSLNFFQRTQAFVAANNAGAWGFERRDWDLERMPQGTQRYANSIASRLHD